MNLFHEICGSLNKSYCVIRVSQVIHVEVQESLKYIVKLCCLQSALKAKRLTCRVLAHRQQTTSVSNRILISNI
jgi:hypothetical protein